MEWEPIPHEAYVGAEEEPMFEYDECCGNGNFYLYSKNCCFNKDYDRAVTDSFNNAPSSSVPSKNPHWIPRNIVGNEVHRRQIKCVICLEIIERGQAYAFCGNRYTPHLFHSKCLYLWLKTANTCPTCRVIFNFDEAPSWWYV